MDGFQASQAGSRELGAGSWEQVLLLTGTEWTGHGSWTDMGFELGLWAWDGTTKPTEQASPGTRIHHDPSSQPASQPDSPASSE